MGRRISTTCLVAVIALGAVGTGCKKKGEATTGADAGSVMIPGVGGDLEAFLRDENAPLTPQIEEQLFLGLKDCNVTDDGIDSKCPGLDRWNKARGRKTVAKQVLGGSSSLGAKYLGDPSPALRYKAADLLGSLFGADGATQKMVVEAAKKEKVPGVLANMIQTVGSRHKGNDEVKLLLLASADHPSERVRGEAMGWFLTSFGQGVPGTFEKVTEKLASDPSIKVRQRLCSKLYGSGDERALPLLEKYLLDKSTPQELYQGCFEGSVATWSGFPRPDKPQQKGFELTMKALEATPRTKDRPPWMGISSMRNATLTPKADDRTGSEWVAKVKPWFKQDRFHKALEAVAMDPYANWMTRGNCVDVMKETGAPKASMERMLKKLDKATGDEALVKKRIEDALKAM